MPAIKQSDMFLEGEGDAWHERNKDKPRLPDPVLTAIDACKLKPKTVLEVGCGTGWRLKILREKYGAWTCGIEPSSKAVYENEVLGTGHILVKTAIDGLPTFETNWADLVIFGFCLYLVDREDLMMIAAHTDRVLKDGGQIIIHDFFPSEPHRIAYKHKQGVWSYHMDYSHLWEWNPAYHRLAGPHIGKANDTVFVLKKDMANAYPERQA